MKRITAICILAAAALGLCGDGINAAPKNKTIYYFYAENCESCRRAQAHFKKPADIKDGTPWNYENISIVPYRIVDGNNTLIKTNIKILNNMCEEIKKKTGKNEIVYYDRETYEYYNNKGIPYYRKQGRYVKKDEAFPTPVFIIGSRVVLGFNLTLINSAISLLQ